MASVEAQQIEQARRRYAAAIGTDREPAARAEYVTEFERIKVAAAQRQKRVG